MAELFHCAKTFVCAVRRVGRLAEAVVAHRADFGKECGDAIRAAWRGHKAFFDTYVDPRNAIEHVDAEFGSQHFFNLEGRTFKVTKDKEADVDQAAVDRVVKLRNEIVAAVLEHFPGRQASALVAEARPR